MRSKSMQECIMLIYIYICIYIVYATYFVGYFFLLELCCFFFHDFTFFVVEIVLMVRGSFVVSFTTFARHSWNRTMVQELDLNPRGSNCSCRPVVSMTPTRAVWQHWLFLFCFFAPGNRHLPTNPSDVLVQASLRAWGGKNLLNQRVEGVGMGVPDVKAPILGKLKSHNMSQLWG